MKMSVQRACGPEHLRASRTFHHLALPLVTTPIVFVRILQIKNYYKIVIQIEVSLVIEINQKSQPTHFPEAMHYIQKHRIKKDLQSVFPHYVLPWYRFPALSQIKPQAPLLVVPLPSILLNFKIAFIISTQSKDFDFSQGHYFYLKK